MEKLRTADDQYVTELSLEELDLICRRCNQLHDEEVLKSISKFFRRLADFFDAGEQQPYHSSAINP